MLGKPKLALTPVKTSVGQLIAQTDITPSISPLIIESIKAGMLNIYT